jgi:hypothetical protein
MVKPTCPSPAPVLPTPTARSAFAQPGVAPAASEEVRDGGAPAAVVTWIAVDGETRLEVPKDVPAVMDVTAVVAALPAVGAVGEAPHAVNVTPAVSNRPPITDTAGVAITGPLPSGPCRLFTPAVYQAIASAQLAIGNIQQGELFSGPRRAMTMLGMICVFDDDQVGAGRGQVADRGGVGGE